jgi:hypothetical protein
MEVEHEQPSTLPLPFGGKPEKNKQTILDKSFSFAPSGNKEPRFSVNVKSGKLVIKPVTEDLFLNTAFEIYRGDYEVLLIPANKEPAIFLDRLADLELHVQKPIPNNVGILDFGHFELVYFIPAPEKHQTNMYAYIIEPTGKSYPVNFEFAVDHRLVQERFINIDNIHDWPDRNDDNLTVLYGDGEYSFYQLAFSPDPQGQVLRLQEVTDISAAMREAKDMGQLLVDTIARDWKPAVEKDINIMRQRFTDEAWNHTGFQYLYENALRSKQKLRLEYAVGVPHHVRILSPEVIQYRVSFNLLDIMKQMTDIEVEIRKQADQWIFHKFGTIQIHEVENNETYNEHHIHAGLVPGIYN